MVNHAVRRAASAHEWPSFNMTDRIRADPAFSPTNRGKEACNAFHQYYLTYVQLIHSTECEIHFSSPVSPT